MNYREQRKGPLCGALLINCPVTALARLAPRGQLGSWLVCESSLVARLECRTVRITRILLDRRADIQMRGLVGDRAVGELVQLDRKSVV